MALNLGVAVLSGDMEMCYVILGSLVSVVHLHICALNPVDVSPIVGILEN